MHTEREPEPRPDRARRAGVPPEWRVTAQLTRPTATPADGFFDVLERRCSAVLGAVRTDDLAALLAHVTRLRFRRNDGRFGAWESRPSPSAGGLHAISLLVLPLEADVPAGLYDDEEHGIAGGDLACALALNARSVGLLTGANTGATIQLVADWAAYESCYDNAASLVWRDSGALCATLALVATALGLGSVVLGRIGNDIVRAAGLFEPWRGAGAIHVTGGVPTRQAPGPSE